MTETLTVTVLETATIFEGPDTVYRYDIVAAGIIEGWAVPAVVDQVRQMCSVSWPEMDVIIDGDEHVTEMLTKTFISKGVSSYPVDALREQPLPEPEAPSTTIQRPTKGRTHRHFYGITPLHLGLSSLLVGAVVTGWLLLGGAEQSPLVQPASQTEAQSGSQSMTVETGAVTPAAQTTTPSAPSTVLVGDGFQLEAPFGFILETDDGGQIVTGPDPDLRVHIGIDLLHGVDPILVGEEVQRMIDADAGLTEQPAEHWGARETIDYSEDPGDGSSVNWVTWFEADRQVSVGCHTRIPPTLVHKASCRKIIETVVLE